MKQYKDAGLHQEKQDLGQNVQTFNLCPKTGDNMIYWFINNFKDKATFILVFL